MRRNGYVSVVCVVALAAVIGCGSSTPSSNTPPPTGLSKRVLLTNQAASAVNLLDAKKNTLTTKTFAAPGASKVLTANGTSLVLDSTQNTMTVIDNAKEAVTFNMGLDDIPADIAITKDGTIAFAAESDLGEVRFGTTADGTVSPTIIHIPSARRLVMSPNGTKLLVFSDPQSQTGINSFFVIDTVSKGFVEVTSPKLDQPFTAVFGSSETQAFILNCGAECGGTAASVVSIDFSGVFSSPPVAATFGTPLLVPAATAGLLNGSTLFVTGTPPPPATPTGPGPACPLSRCGVLTAVNTGSLTISTSVPITDGLHEKMALTGTGRIYIGSSGCTVDPGATPNTVRGCLTIFNTNTLATTFPQESSFRQDFDVTGFQPISNSSVIYVIQGGELDFFDTTTDAIATGITVVDIIGRAFDVVQIDP
jgi:hypothetical protein